MRGELSLHDKITDESGNTIEMKVWRVPASPHMPHGFKYSNAERKGDHRHIRNVETEYVFRSVRQLVGDFQADVARYKENPHES